MPRRRCCRLTFVALGRAASVSWSAPVRAGADKVLASPPRRRNGGAARNRAAIRRRFYCAALTSCAVGPDYLPPSPPLPDHFAATRRRSMRRAIVTLIVRLRRRNGGACCTTASWIRWSSARSPAVRRSKSRLDRLQQARAQEAVVIGAALPSAEWTAGGGWGTGSDLARGRASQTARLRETGAGVRQVVNLVGFDAGWELDIFGKYRREIEAAQYDVDAAVAARNVVLVSLIADVVRAYLDLRALQMELAVLRKNIEVARNMSISSRSASAAASPTSST